MIDDYLTELRSQLRIPSERIVAEVEDHLRESAARDGEDTAIARFGAPASIAARFHGAVADRDARRSVRLLAVAGAVVFGLFIVVDFAQPQAPWPDRAMPIGLEWKLHVAMLLGQVALAAGLISLAHHFLGHRLATLRAAVVALTSAAIALGFHVAFQFDRLGRVQHRPSFTAFVAATAVARALVLAIAAVMVLRAARRVGRFETPPTGRLLRHGWRWCAALAIVAAFAVFAHDEATRLRSVVDGGLEAAVVVAAFALLSRPLGLASGAAYTVRRTPR